MLHRLRDGHALRRVQLDVPHGRQDHTQHLGYQRDRLDVQRSPGLDLLRPVLACLGGGLAQFVNFGGDCVPRPGPTLVA